MNRPVVGKFAPFVFLKTAQVAQPERQKREKTVASLLWKRFWEKNISMLVSGRNFIILWEFNIWG